MSAEIHCLECGHHPGSTDEQGFCKISVRVLGNYARCGCRCQYPEAEPVQLTIDDLVA
jgi:hypothetical protein